MEVTRFVNTASSGGDGTTNGTSGATAAYATMAAWDAAEAVDLVAATDNHIVLCTGVSLDAATCVLGSDWTTSAAFDIVIRPNTGQEHHGVFNTGIYRLRGGSGYDEVLDITGANHVLVDGIQCDVSGLGVRVGEFAGASDVTFANMILVSDGAPPSNAHAVGGSAGSNADQTKTVVNCIMVGFSGNGVHISGGGTEVTNIFNVLNNTAINCFQGFSTFTIGNAITNLYNNVAEGNSSADFNGSWDNTGGNCSGDATSPQTGLRNRTFTFVDEDNNDFHLAAGDTGASGQGDDLSSFSDFPFDYDFEGDTRSAWDSGADEKAAGVVVTDVDGDEEWQDGDSGLVITGTGFV